MLDLILLCDLVWEFTSFILSARGFSASEIQDIRRFADLVNNFPFLVRDSSWIAYGLIIARLRATRLGRAITQHQWRISLVHIWLWKYAVQFGLNRVLSIKIISYLIYHFLTNPLITAFLNVKFCLSQLNKSDKKSLNIISLLSFLFLVVYFEFLSIIYSKIIR